MVGLHDSCNLSWTCSRPRHWWLAERISRMAFYLLVSFHYIRNSIDSHGLYIARNVRVPSCITSGLELSLLTIFRGRAVVGNNSVPPKKWNYSLLQWWRVKRGRPLNGGNEYEEDRSTIQKPKKRVNPLSSLLILFEREGGITLGFGAIFFAGYL